MNQVPTYPQFRDREVPPYVENLRPDQERLVEVDIAVQYMDTALSALTELLSGIATSAIRGEFDYSPTVGPAAPDVIASAPVEASVVHRGVEDMTLGEVSSDGIDQYLYEHSVLEPADTQAPAALTVPTQGVDVVSSPATPQPQEVAVSPTPPPFDAFYPITTPTPVPAPVEATLPGSVLQFPSQSKSDALPPQPSAEPYTLWGDGAAATPSAPAETLTPAAQPNSVVTPLETYNGQNQNVHSAREAVERAQRLMQERPAV